jgi:hypothetical protein
MKRGIFALGAKLVNVDGKLPQGINESDVGLEA